METQKFAPKLEWENPKATRKAPAVDPSEPRVRWIEELVGFDH
jgi:hypothetical protein